MKNGKKPIKNDWISMKGYLNIFYYKHVYKSSAIIKFII